MGKQQNDLDKLYSAVSAEFDIGSIDDFKAKMQTPEDRKRFYDAVSSNGFDLGDYNQYESRLGKNVEVSSPGSAGTSATSVEPTQNTNQQSASLPPQNESSSAPLSGDDLQAGVDAYSQANLDRSNAAYAQAYDNRGNDPNGPQIQSNFGSNLRQPGTFGAIADRASKAIDDALATRAVAEQQMPFLQDNPLAGAIPSPLTEEAQNQYVQQEIMPRVEETNRLSYILDGSAEDLMTPTDETEEQKMDRQLASVDRSKLLPSAQVVYDMFNVKRNIDKMNLLPVEQTELAKKNALAIERGLRLNREDGDRSWATKYIATPLANLGAGIGREGARLVSGALGIPEYANDMIAGAINTGIGLLGGDPETIPNWNETYGDTPLDKNRALIFEAINRNIAKNQARYGDNDIFDTIKSGNIDAAANKIADGIGGMIPFMALLATTGGAGAMAGTGTLAAEQYETLQDQNPDMPGYLKLINSTINGVAETGLEMIGNKVLLEPLQAAVKNLGREQGREVVQSAVEKTLRKLVGPLYPLAPPVIETTTEVATTLTNNIVAKATGEDPDRKITDGFADTIILSMAMSGGTQAATSVLNNISDKSNLSKARQILVENVDIENDLNTVELTDFERSALQETYRKNIETVNEFVENDLNKRDNLTSAQKVLINDLVGMKGAQESLINNPNISETSKKSAQNQVDEINAQIEEIITTVEPSADLSPERVDENVLRFRENNPNTPVPELTEGLPDSAATTLERLDGNQPVDPVAAKEASDALYSKYKELQAMKTDPNRVHTIEEIDAVMEPLGQDIERLESYTTESDTASVEDVSVSDNVVEDLKSKTKGSIGNVTRRIGTETSYEVLDGNGEISGELIVDNIGDLDNVVSYVSVDKGKSNQGIATDAYIDYVNKHGEIWSGRFEDIEQPSDYISEEAKSVWRKLEKLGAKQVAINDTEYRYHLTKDDLLDSVTPEVETPTEESSTGTQTPVQAEKSTPVEESDTEQVRDITKGDKKYYQGIPKSTSFMQGLIDEDGNVLVQGSIEEVENYKKNNGIKSGNVTLVDLDLNNPDSLINKFLGSNNETIQTTVQEETVAPVEDIAATEPRVPQEGDTVTMPPRVEGGVPRNFEFYDGEWKQRVGNELSEISPSQQQQVSQAFENNNQATNEQTQTTTPIGEPAPVEAVQESTVVGEVPVVGPDMGTPAEATGELVTETQQQGGTDAISESQTNEIPSQESPGTVQEVEEEVRDENTTAQEAGPEGQRQVTPKKKSPTIKDLVSSTEVRQARAAELRDRINKYRQSGPGISKDSKREAEYWRDITDYAAIRILDGAISTARQLARELGIAENSKINKAFNDAKRIISEDAEAEMTTARNADTARKRAEMGFDERLPVSTLSNSEVESTAREMIESGYDVGALIDKAVSGSIINATETAILTQYAAAQEAKVMFHSDEIERRKMDSVRVFNEHVEARQNALDNLLAAYQALETAGTEIGRALQIRKQNVYRDMSLANMIVDMRKSKGTVPLTDAEVDSIQKRYKEMSDIAQKIRDRNEELENENARLNALLLTERVQKDIAEANKRRSDKAARKPKTEAISDIRKRREESLLPDFKAAVKEAFSFGQKNPAFANLSEENAKRMDENNRNLAKATVALVKSYIEEVMTLGGKVYLDDIVDRLMTEISEVVPDITRRQVLDLIDASNPERRATKSELTDELNNLRTEVRLIKEIERLENGGDIKEKVTRTTNPNTVHIDELRKKLRELRKSRRDQNKPPSKKRPPVDTQDNYDFKKQAASLRERILEVKKKIREGDYAPPRKQLVLDDTILKGLRKKLQDEQFRYKVDVRKALLDRRGLVGKSLDVAREVFAIPRTLLATGDMSALFRQLMFTAVSRPVMTYKAAIKMHQFWASEKIFNNYFDDYKQSDGFLLAQRAGLSLTDLSENINASAREEMFMSNIVSKVEPYVPIFGGGAKIGGKTIPGLNLHKRAERSFTGAINKMRIDLFNHGVDLLMDQDMYPDTHINDYKALANYVNSVTGRGPMPESWSGVMSHLSAVFFAPRLMASRMFLLAGGPLYNLPGLPTNNMVRKMYARDLVSFVGFGISVVSAASLLGADVDDDPTSTDFGMIRVGDTRYDVWGGFTQYARFIARMSPQWMGGGRVTTSTGRSRLLNTDEWGSMTRLDLLGRFGRSKLSPTASFFTSMLEGKNYMGEPFNIWDEIINMSHPLIIQDVREAWTDYNEGAESLLTTGLPAFYGIGVQTWRTNEFLSYGVDDRLIQLTNDKKVATITPLENRIKLYDLEDGEERQPTGEEFKRYLNLWSEYIKKDLNENYAQYKDMSDEAFDKKFSSIKSKASAYAKEQISGMSTHDKTFTSKGKTYQLTPEQLRKRVEYNEQYMRDNDWKVYNRADKLERQGMTREMALIEARKDLKSDARAYSKKLIEDEFEGELVEKE